jgi:hypothetical protein
LQPGRSGVPDALAVMFRVRRSSTSTRALQAVMRFAVYAQKIGAPVNDPARDPAHHHDRSHAGAAHLQNTRRV